MLGDKMEKERRKDLINIYKNCSDDDLDQMIREGEESFEKGVYELILAEARKRGLDDGSENYDTDIEVGYDYYEQIDFNEISTEDLLGILVNIHTLDELNFHLAKAEAIRRNIDAADIREYKKIVQCEQCGDSIELEIIENPRPLIILKTIDEAGLYVETLDDEGIPFEIQILVDDRDYKKAEMAANTIILPPEAE